MNARMILFAVALFAALRCGHSEDQSNGNGAEGIIRRADQQRRVFGAGEARAEVHSRPVGCDTDAGGQYLLVVPGALKQYMVDYTAIGYLSAQSRTLNNDSKRQKLDDVSLSPCTVASIKWQEIE